MRKYELIFAFILAMILMFLASCRSKQVTINEQVDSVYVSNTLLAEIKSQMLDFSFDSMEIVVPENPICDNVTRCHNLQLNDRRGVKRFSVKIKGGRIKAESNELRAESSEKKDSVKVVSKMESKTIAPQRGVSRWWLVLIAAGVLAFVVITLRKFRAYIK